MSVPATKPPLVTIVTPCLNPGWRLERCIKSVADQTYPRIEHVIVDGGSTDGTVELLESRDDVRWISEGDTGQANAINKGWALGKGEILTWLNADDELLDHAVEASVRCFRNPRVGSSYGNCELVYPDKTQTWVPSGELTENAFDWMMPFPQQGWFVARWALDKVGPLDETLHFSMDYELALRLLVARVPFCYVPQSLARFEIHGDSKTGSHGYHVFLLEAASALERAGRPTAALILRGQAAAHFELTDPAGAREGPRFRQVRSETRSLKERSAVLAGFHCARAVTLSKLPGRRWAHLAAVRDLASPNVWIWRASRSRAWDALRTVLVRTAEALGVR